MRYIISDASKRLNVEPHVLRYWEEELELDITRNELGHRYYSEEDIMVLENIKALKDQGFQLKAIKMLLPSLEKGEEFTHIGNKGEDIVENTGSEWVGQEIKDSPVANIQDNKFQKFQEIMEDMFKKNLESNNDILTEDISEKVIKQMDYLLRMQEEKEEQRFKKFDETIREFQKMRQEAAISKPKKFKLFFLK
ncbi:MerR-like DNA binding protein [Natranaerovirga hydrolytica]|uniref:MerR-like DNA binding protein n=1 Tax=Natranaerovirga hydrolytica TaxID=680378 RepID=A0A4R1N0X0_9FIRM|nr:helix-turn-helix domain-containing protein [Natranaerovirga hydrolytica]TCK99728.1 MerR-like DNA binding protein [Natranaerovirga hydrolytica]